MPREPAHKSSFANIRNSKPYDHVVPEAASKSNKAKLEEGLAKYTYTDSQGVQLVYAVTQAEANRAAKLLKDSTVLGFDIEWKPTFTKGAPENKTALVQLSNSKTIVLLHVSMIHGDFPIQILDILTDPSIKKIGVGIKGDSDKMMRDFKFRLQGAVDLGTFARTADPAGWKGQPTGHDGLATLTAKYLRRCLLKPKKVVRSNWERGLDDRQIEYAANDSHCAFQIYQVLTGMSSGGEVAGSSRPASKGNGAMTLFASASAKTCDAGSLDDTHAGEDSKGSGPTTSFRSASRRPEEAQDGTLSVHRPHATLIDVDM